MSLYHGPHLEKERRSHRPGHHSGHSMLPTSNRYKIEVPNEGGVYVIKCTNYKSFWIYALSESGESLPIDNEDEKIEREWYSIKINDGNTMTVSILSNSSDDNRTLEIGIQAGNAFDSSFLFEQNKN